jgi:hypothetical protein
MVRICSDTAGVEEWRCPTCGRRVLVRWPPDYSRTVLDEGDPDAAHTGGSGVLITGAGLGTGGAAGVEPGPDDRAWLAELGIAWDEDSGN